MGSEAKVKFKEGDVVRCTQDCPGQFTNGNLYEVESVGANSINVVKDDSGRCNGWCFEFFELTTPSPIRTVTRREIVPGEYGPLNAIGVGAPTDSGRIPVDFSRRFWEAKDLREAARIFNEIADALDEQKEAA